MKNCIIYIFMIFIGILYPITSRSQQFVPKYLTGYESLWNKAPKTASLNWFKDAKFGMFIHFSPASQLNGGTTECEKRDQLFEKQKTFEKMDRYSRRQQLLDKIQHVYPETQKMISTFNPMHFNADSITDLALKAGMKYITFTTQHTFGKMYMYDTSLSQWNSQKILKRDFVKELSEACERKGLGLFLYITPPNDYIKEEVRIMLKELLTNYGAIAGIWFDGIGECYRRPNDFLEVGELYAYIHKLQPQCLISFKTGFTGDEDFLAPEWNQVKFDKKGNVLFNIKVATDNGTEIAEDSHLRPVLRYINNKSMFKHQSFKETWENELKIKPIELCNTMIKGEQWFDVKNGEHKTINEITEEYNYAQKNNANYLLNIALLGDGSIHNEDKYVLSNFKPR